MIHILWERLASSNLFLLEESVVARLDVPTTPTVAARIWCGRTNSMHMTLGLEGTSWGSFGAILVAGKGRLQHLQWPILSVAGTSSIKSRRIPLQLKQIRLRA
jgi:hypothetical protein